MLKVKEQDMLKLLEEVDEALLASVKKSEEEVKKEEPSDKKEESSGADASASTPDVSPSPDAAPPAAPDASADASAAPADPAMDAGPETSVESLAAEYKKLPPDQLQMHAQALQMAVQEAAAPAAPGAGMPDASASAGPAAPPAPPEATPAPQPPPAMKNETKSEVEEALKKAEAKWVAENASLKEDVEILTGLVKSVIETPVRKAITSIDQLAREEKKEAKAEVKPMDPQTFWAKLREISKRPDLKKSEKQLIYDVYTKQVDVSVAARDLAKLFADE